MSVHSPARRQFLGRAALATIPAFLRPRTALGAVGVNSERRAPDHVLVTIFLRGGADGLSLVVPYGDDYYHRSRPTLALASPGKGGGTGVADLDGYFGLHPALRPLLPLYQSGQMAIVHACGSGDQTRSHFEAMATMERGLYGAQGPASGWIARHLASAPWRNPSPLRAVALGSMVPDALRGATSATALQNVSDLALHDLSSVSRAQLHECLHSMYNTNNGALGAAGLETLGVLKTLEDVSSDAYHPANGAVYPADDLGRGLMQTALLVKKGVGVEAACLDHYGYDTHVAQGGAIGLLAGQLTTLGASVAAFAKDLGPERWARTTVVVQSEFGRRVEENSGAGTDHGRAGVMFVMGGSGVAGGRIHGKWPGLSPEQRDGPGDLRVTTDYRNVLGEVLARRAGNTNVGAVFPGLQFSPTGVTHA
ncbi:MAG: DUF1501 domain-containing protein [Capsulimonas sp.]|uniref:DUF1501 domain-containing protein n=1 Tax=Capsulimonas sp. TaxID=2494211 RepID=UPI0032633BAC